MNLTIGAFHDYILASNAYHAMLSRNPEALVSFLARELTEGETPHSATLVFSGVSNNLIHFDFAGLGQLVMSGPFAHQLLSTKSFSPEMKGSLAQSFIDSGIDPHLSQQLADLVSEGQVLIFVPGDSAQESETILQEFGVIQILQTRN